MTTAIAQDPSAEGKGKETQASAVYGRLRSDILTTDIPPGRKLLIRELCERYGVGLNPMREALNRAVTEGLVQQADLRGFFAAPASEDDLRDLTRARSLLTEIVLRESILNGGSEWEEGIVVAHHRLARAERYASGQTDPLLYEPGWEAAHRDFHRSLVAACGSSRLLEMHERLFDAADRYRLLARRTALSGTPERPDQHGDIVRAVLDRNAPEAVALLQAHYQRTADYGLRELVRMRQREEKR
jgi:DNA-binding GntR family transcriptional regulator